MIRKLIRLTPLWLGVAGCVGLFVYFVMQTIGDMPL